MRGAALRKSSPSEQRTWGGHSLARPVTLHWPCSWIAEKQKRHKEEERKRRRAAGKRGGDGAQPEAPQGAAPQQGSAGPQTSITVAPLLS